MLQQHISLHVAHPLRFFFFLKAVQPRVATYVAQGITMAHYAEGAAYTVSAIGPLSGKLVL